MNQQPQVIYVQKERNGCLWALAAIGLLAIALFLLALWGTVKFTQDVNQVPYVLDTAVQTLEATAPEMKVERASSSCQRLRLSPQRPLRQCRQVRPFRCSMIAACQAWGRTR
jgi:hypothetical protein